jgi:coproporphyrinogen III oxidase-like Fe-S oxidoreductase
VDEVALTPALLAADALIFGLRLNRGVDLRAWAARFPEFDFAALAPLWEDLAAAGLLEMPSKPFPRSADDSSQPASSLLLPPSSFTLHPSSFVSPPSSFLRLTRAGRLVADRVGVAILEAGECQI